MDTTTFADQISTGYTFEGESIILGAAMENGKPLTVLQFPDGPSVIIAGDVLTIHRALDLHLIGRDDDGDQIAQRMRLAAENPVVRPFFQKTRIGATATAKSAPIDAFRR